MSVARAYGYHAGMCVVALALGQHPQWPLVVVANRDEYHDRAALAAAPWVENAAAIGGRDRVAGGAWFGAHRDGRFAVVTNFRLPSAPLTHISCPPPTMGADPSPVADAVPSVGLDVVSTTLLPTFDPRRTPQQRLDTRATERGETYKLGVHSRGELVRNFVLGDAMPSAWIEALNQRREDYAPFNLVVGIIDDVWWLESVSGAHGRFAPGTYAFSNGPVFEHWPKCQGVAAAVQCALRANTPAVDAFMAALADTSPAADAELPDTGVGLEMERFLSPICIVGARYGTRASTLLALSRNDAHYLLERRFGPHGVPAGESAWIADASGWSASAWPDVLATQHGENAG